ncbi:amidohydrolase [Candidatus Lokiarchaeum ossiferum]|uniref:amidohydrolase n=1 Tax=Candidatus Lokiarchaeum ossiferum TaxID=2951803 RepID=UPI00352C1833
MQIFHGPIITCDKENHVFKYLVEDQGKILFVGDDLPNKYDHHGNIIELQEKALLPSFGDGHMHFSNYALFAGTYFDVREAKNFDDIKSQITKFITKHPKKKIIIAFGASKHSVEEKRLIPRQELDLVCPKIPLVIVCYDGHSAICNSVMMNKFPEKIQKLRGFNADQGYLFNEAYYDGVDYATSLISPITLINSMIKSYDIIAKYGVGMIHATEGIGFPNDLDVTLVSLIAKAKTKKNSFQSRIFFQTMEIEKVLKRKLPRIGGCFATALDGCFGACDAALHEPYSNDLDNNGILFQSEDEVYNFAKKANRAGLQIEMHAIGDAAVTRAVNAIEQALEDFPRDDHRHTIIHACLIRPEDMEKIARLGIGITLQPGFLISPLEPIEYLEEILGSRVKSSSPLRKIKDAGIHLSGGSDAPVTHPNPIEGIYGACNHPYDPSQSLTVQEALHMYTSEVAWTTFDDHDRGSLEQGKIADLVILNKNPLKVEPANLLSLKVEQLYLSGQKYKSGMGIPSMLWNGLIGKNPKT